MTQEQFRQWSNLDPSECTRRETSVFESEVYTVNGTNFFVKDADVICFMPGEAEMWLERALRRAIVARGWSFDLRYNSHHRVYHAMVNFGDNVGTFDTPAEALLSAYVRALDEGGQREARR